MNIYCYKYEHATGGVVLAGVVDNFESFTFNRSYSDIGTFTLVISGALVQAEYLLKSDIIRAGAGVCGLITRTTEEKNESGYTVTATGYELKYLASKRLVVPPAGHAYVDLWGVSATRLVRRLLETQLTQADDVRIIPGSVVVDDGADAGESIDYSGRYSSLKDDIVSVCTTYELGWYADIEDGAIVWHLFRGLDRSAGQSANSRLLLSYKYDTIAAASYDETRHASNYGVVAGQGEGVDRTIITVGDSSGFGRSEVFIDARDVSTPSEPAKPDIDARYDEPVYPSEEIAAAKAQMTGDEKNDEVLQAYIDALEKTYKTNYEAWADNDATWDAYDTKVTEYAESVDAMYDALYTRGREKMAEYGETQVMEMTAADLLTRNYRSGFDLGDKGTLLDLNVDFRLTAIEEVYENNSAEVHYTYGYDAGSLSAALKRMAGKFSSLMGVEVVKSNG